MKETVFTIAIVTLIVTNIIVIKKLNDANNQISEVLPNVIDISDRIKRILGE